MKLRASTWSDTKPFSISTKSWHLSLLNLLISFMLFSCIIRKMKNKKRCRYAMPNCKSKSLGFQNSKWNHVPSTFGNCINSITLRRDKTVFLSMSWNLDVGIAMHPSISFCIHLKWMQPYSQGVRVEQKSLALYNALNKKHKFPTKDNDYMVLLEAILLTGSITKSYLA